MLQKLHIENYAIIDQLDVRFSEGLNIVTGETGAGKSILMGALRLILGERSDSSTLRDPNKKSIIEGTFLPGKRQSVDEFFLLNDLDAGEEIIIRREISPQSKSRNFINDTPVNLSQLRLLGNLLVDLHQQFDTLEIHSSAFQMDVVDAMADNASLLKEMRIAFEQLRAVDQQLNALIEKRDKARLESDYRQFIFEEINSLGLKSDELERLDEELKLLTNAEQIKHQLQQMVTMLEEGQQPVLHTLKSVTHSLSNLQDLVPSLQTIKDRMNSIHIELKDVVDEISRAEASVSYNETAIESIQERLNAGYKLLKKHGLKTTNELLALQESLSTELESFHDMDTAIEELNQKHTIAQQQCQQIAKQLAARRKKHIPELTEQINALLVKVGMPNALVRIDLQAADLNVLGTDQVSFLFDANKSQKFEPLSKVASGGELSRLMLIIKSLVAKKLELPTLIFDEIDTGISGEAARQVGLIMKTLAGHHQLISITHQAQIAALADHHLFVYKQQQSGGIQTHVKILEQDERIQTIAGMISGEKPTAAAIANARELMGIA